MTTGEMWIASLIAGFALGVGAGWTGKGWQVDAATLAQIKVDESAQKKVTADVASSAKETASAVENVRYVYRTINKEVIKYVTSASAASCVLDDEFVRIHNRSTQSAGRLATDRASAP